ncbi:MAG: hypothetical protein SGI83_10305 [Bacteroidota bacterium]|mgnify:CR=1 FL=1|nr:hypothetical protein [Bacteroidota bacterium]
MRLITLSFVMIFSLSVNAQEERDTVLRRCPLFITDTLTSNNFFIEARPATLKVYRVKGDLTVVVEQKDQFFSMFFNDKRLKSGKYKISVSPDGRNELAAKYSFRSGEQVSYVNVSKGTVEVTYDKENKLWRLKVNGLIANLVERSVTYYKVRADLSLK